MLLCPTRTKISGLLHQPVIFATLALVLLIIWLTGCGGGALTSSQTQNPSTSTTITLSSITPNLVGCDSYCSHDLQFSGSGFAAGNTLSASTLIPNYALPSGTQSNQFIYKLDLNPATASPGLFSFKVSDSSGNNVSASMPLFYLGNHKTMACGCRICYGLDPATSSSGGTLYEFDSATGTKLRQFNVPAVVSIAVDNKTCSVVTAEHGGNISWNSSDGIQRGSIAAGQVSDLTAKNGFGYATRPANNDIVRFDLTNSAPALETQSTSSQPWVIQAGNTELYVYARQSSTLLTLDALNGSTIRTNALNMTPETQDNLNFSMASFAGTIALLHRPDQKLALATGSTVVIVNSLPNNSTQIAADPVHNVFVLGASDISGNTTQLYRVDSSNTITKMSATIPFLATAIEASEDGGKIRAHNRSQFVLVDNK